MKHLVLVCIAAFGLAACSAQEQPPPPPEPTEVPLSTAEQTLVDERIAAIREADDFEAAREAHREMDDRYTATMRERVNVVFNERYRQAVDAADTEEEIEPLRKLAPDMAARLYFNGRWIELRNKAEATKN